jgi:signal transduction histidine kinase/ActR/RegA family two-component response regulator
MPSPPTKRPRRGIFARAALLSTLLVVFSVGPCAALFMLQNRKEKRATLEQQAAKVAERIASSVSNVSFGSERDILKETCLKLIRESPDIDYLIVAPRAKDKLTLLFGRSTWEEKPAQPEWTPDDFSPGAAEGVSMFTGERVLTTTRRIEAGGFALGWVHTGVSLNSYEQALAAGLQQTLLTALLAAVAGIVGAFLLARRVAVPLAKVCDMADVIAGGDLGARVTVKSTGEVQHLASHMNTMAEMLEQNAGVIADHQRDLEITNAKLLVRIENEQLLSRISADFLFAESSAPNELFLNSLRRIASRLGVDGASIFLHDTADHASLRRAWEWHSENSPGCTLERAPTAGFPWATAIATGRNVVTVTDSHQLPEEAAAERTNLERLQVRSAAAALLGAGDKAAGYLFLRHSSPRVWTTEEEQFIHLAAGILSNAIARRSAALDREQLHAQLLQAQKMEAVGKLSGGIAHDFNNMLVPIVGYSDSILNNAPGDAPWLNEVREIKRSAESAASLTRQLLSFSRKQIISRKEMDLNAHIQKLQHMIRRLIGENIHLQTELAPDLWTVSADASQIEQCLMNLTVNAKAAMPRGGSIRISTEMVDSEDRRFQAPPLRKPQGLFARITVRDAGCGMDKATLSRIFEPFFSTKGEEGTGLGLSVVYGIMEEHGGWITVESEPEKGTAFHLWMPALNEPVPQPMDSGLAVARPLPRGNGQRILLVEDEPGVLAFVSAALRQHGYAVVTADCGTAAREVFAREQETIDLVMSDVVLPDATGMEILEEFYQQQPGLRALLSSGYSEKQALVELVEKRGVHFLHKPYTLIQLLEAVHKTLRGLKPESIVT